MDKSLEDLASAKVSLLILLLKAGNTDTVYRDLYFDRARRILAEFLPHAEYLRQQRNKAEIDNLFRQVALTLERREWAKLKELTSRMRLLEEITHEKYGVSELAREIYESIEVPFNPFDPRLFAVRDFKIEDPAQLRHQLVATLMDLEKVDLPWRKFYSERRVFFDHLTVAGKAENGTENVYAALVQKEAKAALQNRDIRSLERLAEEMLKPKERIQGLSDRPELAARSPIPNDESEFTFSDGTLSAARRLGLASVQTDSSQEFGEYLQCCCAWHANISDRPLTELGKCFAGCTCGHPCPPSIPATLKETLDLLMVQQFINSAGVRYLPRFGSERVLVENFPEDNDYGRGSELLDALGLPRRAALSRLQIEQALQLQGAEIIEKNLGLNPREFRLVCIPFDLYARLAPGYGWGQKKLWTHFDGFQIWKGPKLRALVGGDVQFGGRYDLCSISRSDENDRVIARFAVVGRDRFQLR